MKPKLLIANLGPRADAEGRAWLLVTFSDHPEIAEGDRLSYGQIADALREGYNVLLTPADRNAVRGLSYDHAKTTLVIPHAAR